MENKPELKDGLPFFRVNRIPKTENVVLTNAAGNFIVLSEKEFDDYVSGKTEPGSETMVRLERKGFFLRDGYVEEMAEKYWKRMAINFIGPTLHIIVMTKGCNHQCLYCHASAQFEEDPDNEQGLALTDENGLKIVDTILESPAHSLDIEFQGGEPLLNWSGIKKIVVYAKEKNAASENPKELSFSLVSNLTLITEGILEEIREIGGINLSTSLDGPKAIHDYNRIMISKIQESRSSFNVLEEKISLIRAFEKKHSLRIL